MPGRARDPLGRRFRRALPEQVPRCGYTAAAQPVVAAPWAALPRGLRIPMSLDQARVLQLVYYPIDGWTRAADATLYFPTIHIPTVLMSLEQYVQDLQGWLSGTLDSSHAYIIASSD